MKIILVCALFISFSASLSFAEESPEHQDGPCKKIMDSCKEAVDAAKGTNQKLSLYKDCFKPLMNNEATVMKVSYDKADVSACKAKREAHQQKKGK